jgi:NAD(P)-dependent dehydrogenase (short-subunit alcohol dehydrogenase family)
MERVVVVTGAGRGIGAELCRQSVAAGDVVVACPRTVESPDLARVEGRGLHVVPADVSDADSIGRAASEIAGLVGHVDLLVHSAGVYPREAVSFDRLDPETLVQAFRVNAVGPLRVTAALLPLLRKGSEKRIVALTSRMGSIDDNRSGGSYAYRLSKTALNMAVRNLDHELGPEGFVVLALHPGWVRTRMGGGDRAPLAVDAAAAEILRAAWGADRSVSGAMLGPGGERIAW